ncbi:hypothetical protein CDV36_015239 [Fusarium kuroshium]|uniref:ABM domain-containing protein n=1 Tax=Fusarium kuroshium TaxID=2010991 RepID=A0A3M2RBF4_9HYPO|nr:hypothetical protein CDV36_015239 [Fusarium kuroshium]
MHHNPQHPLTTTMCAQKSFSEWPGFSTWTRFKANSPIDDVIFEPLCSWSGHINTPAYGRIADSQDYILAVGWNSRGAYEEFEASPQYQQLMDNLGADTAKTQIIIFTNKMFGRGFTSNTEIFTAYWPASLSPETQQEVKKTKSLVHNGIPNPRCYSKGPAFGWIDELQTWNEEKVLASVWCHHWKSKELEDRFKSTEKRVVYVGKDIVYPLAVDDFEQHLKELGCLGWESIRVDFVTLNMIYDDEKTRSHRRERRKLDDVTSGMGAL